MLARNKNKHRPIWFGISGYGLAYNIVCNHFHRSDKETVFLLIKSTAGSEKSYLIDALEMYSKQNASLH